MNNISDKISKQINNDEVSQLLLRKSFTLDYKKAEEFFEDKVIMVTGGGGSIGSELCRTVAAFKPRSIVIVDIYENNAYEIQNEIAFCYPELEIKTVIASIRDRKRIESVIKEFSPDIVFHAAAHKHVPLMEENPGEAVKNNVFGTLYLAECADAFGVSDFILISTDKAVNPTNVMGATKKFGEMIISAFSAKSKTRFSAVRFGNVLGSNGSVIPLFKRQIESGGPVTLTHEEATRYFLTIPEAVKLVLQAATAAEGGEIFVLDMGEPVKIYDLACRLICSYGLTPNKDIEVKTIGLRDGEKLHEELKTKSEDLSKTKYDRIFAAEASSIDMTELEEKISMLKEVAFSENSEHIKDTLLKTVPDYRRRER